MNLQQVTILTYFAFLFNCVFHVESVKVYFSSHTYYTQEGYGRVVIGVTAERPTSRYPGEISVVISLIPESAEEGRDYFPLLEESIELVQWPNITYFTVGIIDDMEMEGQESFSVHLRDVISPNAVIGQPNLAEIIIEDNDEVCPNGWYFYKNSCYLFMNQSISYLEAVAACKEEEACLATSTSEGENEFIANTVTKGQKSWIGGSRLCHGNEWQWTNGETWEYTNWRKGEPNNEMKQEHCLELNYVRPGLWNDMFCHRRNSAVCECYL
ncbi:Lectin [Holothuria leucospilota]|uniref:Lectin n=1 Tax=Holothuria leucospilota TaxID=206669 RepID=A0A9Q1BBF1_HOLLE|nr:Lectin [Holothuria leucospilota]